MAIFNSYVSLPEGTPKAGWFRMENSVKMDDLGITTICAKLQIVDD